MKAIRETTLWDTPIPNHMYLLDGDALMAYIPQGAVAAHWFSKPIKRFDSRRRTFEPVAPALFGPGPSTQATPQIRTVAGSKPGVTYTLNLDRGSCSCPGFTFRGACKHVQHMVTGQ